MRGLGRPPTGGRSRLASAYIGDERRYAVLATDHPLARNETVRLADFVDHIMAIDAETATTTDDLWEPGTRPAGYRTTHGVDEWLTLIASGHAIGISSERPEPSIPAPASPTGSWRTPLPSPCG